MGKNCWEVKNCGRQAGGSKEAELGRCPAAAPSPYDGHNGGSYAGRYCWRVAGTLCGGQVQGAFAAKLLNCSKCEVYNGVREEEGARFQV